MTQEQLTLFAGVALSLVLAYVPGIKTWYDPLEAQVKASIMAGLLLLVAIAVFGLSCGGFVQLGVTCDKQGIVGLVQIYIMALIANQGTFLIAVKPFKQSPSA